MRTRHTRGATQSAASRCSRWARGNERHALAAGGTGSLWVSTTATTSCSCAFGALPLELTETLCCGGLNPVSAAVGRAYSGAVGFAMASYYCAGTRLKMGLGAGSRVVTIWALQARSTNQSSLPPTKLQGSSWSHRRYGPWSGPSWLQMQPPSRGSVAALKHGTKARTSCWTPAA